MAGIENEMGRVHMKHEQRAIGEGKKLSFLLRFVLSHTQIPNSSPAVSKLSVLINYLLGKRLGYACGEDGKALKSPF